MALRVEVRRVNVSGAAGQQERIQFRSAAFSSSGDETSESSTVRRQHAPRRIGIYRSSAYCSPLLPGPFATAHPRAGEHDFDRAWKKPS